MSVIQNQDDRRPAADLIPGGVDLFVVLAEDESLAVVLDRVRAQPAGFEFDLLVAGPAHSIVVVAAYRAARESTGGRAAAAPGLGETTALLECGVQFPGTDLVVPRVQMKSSSSHEGETNASFWVRPLPPEGDAVCMVAVGDLTGTAAISGDDLRTAAAQARHVGRSGQ